MRLTLTLAFVVCAIVVLQPGSELRAEQFDTVILRLFGGDSGGHGGSSQGGSVIAEHPGDDQNQNGDGSYCDDQYSDPYGDSYGDHCTPTVIDDSNYGGLDNDPSSVPEPGTLALLGLGAAAAGAYRIRRRKKSAS